MFRFLMRYCFGGALCFSPGNISYICKATFGAFSRMCCARYQLNSGHVVWELYRIEHDQRKRDKRAAGMFFRRAFHSSWQRSKYLRKFPISCVMYLGFALPILWCLRVPCRNSPRGPRLFCTLKTGDAKTFGRRPPTASEARARTGSRPSRVYCLERDSWRSFMMSNKKALFPLTF